MKFFLIFAIIPSLLVTTNVFAMDSFDEVDFMSLQKNMKFKLDALTNPNGKDSSTDQKLSENLFGASASVVVFGRDSEPTDSKVSFKAAYDNLMINSIRSDLSKTSISRVRLSLTDRFVHNSELYSFTLSGDDTGETLGSTTSTILPTASFLATWTFENKAKLLYGTAYSYVFGRGILFPIIGVSWKSSGDWRFLTIVPVAFIVEKNFKDNFSFDAFVKAAGFSSKMSTDSVLTGPSDSATIRQRGADLGAGLGYRFNEDFKLSGQLGISVARSIEITSSTSNRTINLSNSAFLKMNLDFY